MMTDVRRELRQARRALRRAEDAFDDEDEREFNVQLMKVLEHLIEIIQETNEE